VKSWSVWRNGRNRTRIFEVLEGRLENLPGSRKVQEVELRVQGKQNLERVIGHCGFLMDTHLVDVQGLRMMVALGVGRGDDTN